jgi:hypothetical protein
MLEVSYTLLLLALMSGLLRQADNVRLPRNDDKTTTLPYLNSELCYLHSAV